MCSYYLSSGSPYAELTTRNGHNANNIFDRIDHEEILNEKDWRARSKFSIFSESDFLDKNDFLNKATFAIRHNSSFSSHLHSIE